MKDRSDDPSHHERTLLPRSIIDNVSDVEEKVTKHVLCASLDFEFNE